VALAEAIVASSSPPAVFVSASGVGIYGDRPGELLDESSTTGDGFFPDLVRAWEAASAIASGAARVVNARNAVVIARGGGLTPVRLLTSVGLGAGFARGTQYWPWISLDDVAGAFIHLIVSRLTGPVIVAGPTPATSDEVTEAFARVMHRPHLLRVPALAVKALGEAGDRLLLDDMHVLPRKLELDGFVWAQPTITDAVRAIA
jgi:uncharacterized protein (TIGR01777 family)